MPLLIPVSESLESFAMEAEYSIIGLNYLFLNAGPITESEEIKARNKQRNRGNVLIIAQSTGSVE